MKKLLCLGLCAILCISVALPSLAETAPSLTKPLKAEEYIEYFEAFMRAASSCEEIKWITPEQEATLRLAILDGWAPGIGFIQEGDLVDEVSCAVSGELDEALIRELETLILCAACPLLMREGYDVTTAYAMVNDTLVAWMLDASLVNTLIDWYGINSALLVSSNEDGTVSLQLMLDFLPEAEQ